jgi:hypothetical protein
MITVPKQCEYAPEQIISQNRALAMAHGAQQWMLIGSLVLLGVGLFLFGRLALKGGCLEEDGAFSVAAQRGPS